jgi:hypothetical protein
MNKYLSRSDELFGPARVFWPLHRIDIRLIDSPESESDSTCFKLLRQALLRLLRMVWHPDKIKSPAISPSENTVTASSIRVKALSPACEAGLFIAFATVVVRVMANKPELHAGYRWCCPKAPEGGRSPRRCAQFASHKQTFRVLDCGGKRSATPLWGAGLTNVRTTPTESAVAAVHPPQYLLRRTGALPAQSKIPCEMRSGRRL